MPTLHLTDAEAAALAEFIAAHTDDLGSVDTEDADMLKLRTLEAIGVKLEAREADKLGMLARRVARDLLSQGAVMSNDNVQVWANVADLRAILATGEA